MENQEKNDVEKLYFSHENTLNVIANVVLVVGIISTFVCSFTIVIVEKPYYGYSREEPSLLGLGITVGILLTSLVIWASLRVLSNISVSLKEIKRKKY